MKMMYEAGETIEGGQVVAISDRDGKAYAARSESNGSRTLIGLAVDRCREGFMLRVDDGKVREDDA